ncbi:hypothetical protein K438DRAFT_1995231 [Mycena galopus ATCC 62051]|nr:hypothetical protein K438DRAFT_1995231 [Mycena galopus ATCC 62051]
MAEHIDTSRGTEFEVLYGPSIGGMRVILTNPEPPATQMRPAPNPSAPASTPIATHTLPTDVWRFHTPAEELIPARYNATDKWHSNPVVCVPLACSVVPSISMPLAPTHGPYTVGVALTELALSRGLPDPRKRLSAAPYWAPIVGHLIFTWPDYPNTRVSETLTVKEETRQYLTRKAFTKQIANLFKLFIEKHSSEYVPPTGRRGWRLGPGGIMLEQLRLLEVFSADGENYHVRMGVVAPRSGVIVAQDALLL